MCDLLFSKVVVLLVESMDLIGEPSLRCLFLCKNVPFAKIFGRDIASFVRLLSSKKDILSQVFLSLIVFVVCLDRLDFGK